MSLTPTGTESRDTSPDSLLDCKVSSYCLMGPKGPIFFQRGISKATHYSVIFEHLYWAKVDLEGQILEVDAGIPIATPDVVGMSLRFWLPGYNFKKYLYFREFRESKDEYVERTTTFRL